MPSSSERSSSFGSPAQLLSAPGLSVVALVLFVLFATLVAGALWPVQLLNPWRLLPELLRNGLACLALALGFAALAVRPGAEVSLLREWQGALGYWQWRLQQRRVSRRDGSSDEDYIRQLSGDEED